jgi:hypothetical protein
MDAGRYLSVFDCVAIQEHSNQSKSATHDVVMGAQPGLLTVTDMPYVGLYKEISSYRSTSLSSN